MRSLFSLSFLSSKEKGKGAREGLHGITIEITDSQIHDISNADSGRIISSEEPLQKTACRNLSPFRRR